MNSTDMYLFKRKQNDKIYGEAILKVILFQEKLRLNKLNNFRHQLI